MIFRTFEKSNSIYLLNHSLQAQFALGHSCMRWHVWWGLCVCMNKWMLLCVVNQNTASSSHIWIYEWFYFKEQKIWSYCSLTEKKNIIVQRNQGRKLEIVSNTFKYKHPTLSHSLASSHLAFCRAFPVLLPHIFKSALPVLGSSWLLIRQLPGS